QSFQVGVVIQEYRSYRNPAPRGSSFTGGWVPCRKRRDEEAFQCFVCSGGAGHAIGFSKRPPDGAVRVGMRSVERLIVGICNLLPRYILGIKLLEGHREQRQRIRSGRGVNEIIDKRGLEDVAFGL